LSSTAADLRNASRELIIDYINLTRGREVFIQVSFPVSTSSFWSTYYSVFFLHQLHSIVPYT